MVEANNQPENELSAAMEQFRLGNLSQAEIHVRRCLSRENGNPQALELLDRLRRAYGISDC